MSQVSPAIPKHGVVTMYNCGGGGINIGALFSNQADLTKSSAIIKTTFIDTSDSNFRKKSLPNDEIYLIKNLKKVDGDTDGSGKVRAENAEAIVKETPKILKEHPPGDLSIVSFTSGGGSGSVIGPALVAELLERGKDVFVVVIGVVEDDLTIENTEGTIKSLQSSVETYKRPVNLHFLMHEPGMSREDINNRAQFFMSSVCILASRQNDELDTADVSRFLNYHTIPRQNLEPALTLVHVDLNAEDVAKKYPDAFAMACVLKDTEQSVPDIRLAYKCTGYLPIDDSVSHNLFFTSETTGLNDLRATIAKHKRAVADNRGARSQAVSFLEESDKPVKGGLVL